MNKNLPIIKNFYGVYLLYCKNPKFKGRTYIGYTVDPNRRIQQHNKGKHAGGAWKTSKRGPWSMVMIIHGFPNDIAALRFEWAWQHPQTSRRLKHLSNKKHQEKSFDYNLRILSEMLKIGPWNRLPLNIRWLDEDLVRDFPPYKIPPTHMPIVFGNVLSKKLSKNKDSLNETFVITRCYLCSKNIENSKLECLRSSCDFVSHIICLAKALLKCGEYVPIDGNCPKCDTNFLWGDLIRNLKGCYENMDITLSIDVLDNVYCSDSE